MRRGRAAVLAGLGLAALAGVAWLGAALAEDPATTTAPVDAAPGPIASAVSDGRHLRIDGPRGPIHVWLPKGYQADTAGTVIYVHGYWDNADTAWSAHQLPQQFALSALNAMFIVPEAPTYQKEPVNYPDLGELLRVVETEASVPRGAAYTAALGHSGAFRTLEAWLDEPLLDELVMIDASYGDEDVIINWVNASDRRRLMLVGEDTVLGTESIASKLSDVLTLDRFPPAYDLWPAEARTAKILYVRAQYAHMPLVNQGIVIPSLLRLLPVAQLANLPWKLPLGSLPPYPDAGTLVDDGLPR